MSTLAENLRTARRFNGWTQEQLAEKAGVSQTTIDKIEQGKTLKSRFLPNIALALNVPIEVLDPVLAAARADWEKRLRENVGQFYVRRTLEELPLYEMIPGSEMGVFTVKDYTTMKVPAPRYLDGSNSICIGCINDLMSPELEIGDACFFDIDASLYAGKTGLFISRRPPPDGNYSGMNFIIARLVRADEESWFVRLIGNQTEVKLSIKNWPISAPLRVRYSADPATINDGNYCIP